MSPEKMTELIQTYYNNEIHLKATIANLNDRIASLLEAEASIPTRDVNGTIEAQYNLIKKLKGDVLKLQAKVTEQDSLLAIATESNKERR